MGNLPMVAGVDGGLLVLSTYSEFDRDIIRKSSPAKLADFH